MKKPWIVKRIIERVTKTGIDEKQLYMQLHLYALSTGEATRSELFRHMAKQEEYAPYSTAMGEIDKLGSKLRYGLPKACITISKKMKNESFKGFLSRLGEAIAIGERLQDFFEREFMATLMEYKGLYERSITSVSVLLSLYSSVMSSLIFIIAFTLLLSVFWPVDPWIMLSSIIAMLTALIVFVILMFLIFPKDKVICNNPADWKYKAVNVLASVATITTLAISIYSVLTYPSVRLEPIFAAGAACYFIPGMLARALDKKVREYEKSYPSFIRHIGDIYQNTGSLEESFKSIIKAKMDTALQLVQRGLKRVRLRIPRKIVWLHLSKETSSELIERGNKIIADAMDYGALVGRVSEKVAYVSSIILDLRNKRIQTAKSFESIIFILHPLTIALMMIMNELMRIFNEIFSSLGSTARILSFGHISPMVIYVTSIMSTLALVYANSLAIKAAFGGYFGTFYLTLSLMFAITTCVLFASQMIMQQFLFPAIELENIKGLGGI